MIDVVVKSVKHDLAYIFIKVKIIDESFVFP